METIVNLTHRQIEIFRAIMVSGQVTRAAALLFTSQPTLSRELNRLEAQLGYGLFDRQHGRLLPTTRAHTLMAEVERAYVGLERVAAVANALRHAPHGRVLLASMPALGHALVPAALARMRLTNPDVALLLDLQESPALELSLSEQRYDVGLTERRDAPPGTVLRSLLEADEVVVLPAGHPLCGRRVVTPDDLDGMDMVVLAAQDPYRQQFDRLMRERGLAPQVVVETPSAVSVCAMVRQGLGFGVVNPLTALELAGPELVVRQFAVSVPFHVGLVVPQWRQEHPLRTHLMDALSQAAVALRQQLDALTCHVVT